MASNEQFLRRITIKIGRRGLGRARPATGSKTLSAAMRVRVYDNTHADIFVPHYWSSYVHDGRKPFIAPFGPMLWFRNPKDDPRLDNGHSPERLADVKRLNLSREEFFEELRSGRVFLRRDRRLPRAIYKNTPGKFFFGNAPGQAMYNFGKDLEEELDNDIRNHMRDKLKKYLVQKERKVVVRL